MRKAPVFSALLALSCPLWAHTSSPYVAIGIGGQDQLNKTTSHEVDSLDVSETQMVMGGSKLKGAVALGYFQAINAMLGVGLQLDGSWSDSTVSLNSIDVEQGSGTDTLHMAAQNHFNWGINARPTFALTDISNGFITLGYRRAKFRAIYNENDAGGPVLNSQSKHFFNGFEYGVGAEIRIQPQVGIRFEASQTLYPQKRVIQPGDGTTIDNKPKINQALLSVVWYPNWNSGMKADK